MSKNNSQIIELFNIYKQKMNKIVNVLSIEIKELILDFKNIFKSNDKISLKLNNVLKKLRKTSLPFKFTTIAIVIFAIFLSSGQDLTSKQVIAGLKSGKYHVIAVSKSSNNEIKKCSQAKLVKSTGQLWIYNFTDGGFNSEVFWQSKTDDYPYHNPFARMRNKTNIEDTTHVKNGNRLMLVNTASKGKAINIGELCLFDTYPYPLEKMRSGKPIELNYYSKKKGCPKPDFRIHPLIGLQNAAGNAYSNWRFKGVSKKGKSLILTWSTPRSYTLNSTVTLGNNDEVFVTSFTNIPTLKRRLNYLAFKGKLYPCYDN
jgi:hypothetical protein